MGSCVFPLAGPKISVAACGCHFRKWGRMESTGCVPHGEDKHQLGGLLFVLSAGVSSCGSARRHTHTRVRVTGPRGNVLLSVAFTERSVNTFTPHLKYTFVFFKVQDSPRGQPSPETELALLMHVCDHVKGGLGSSRPCWSCHHSGWAGNVRSQGGLPCWPRCATARGRSEDALLPSTQDS